MAASEDGRLIKTYDGGVTWQQQVIASGYPLWHDFAWSDQNNVYVCGTPEMVFTSANGGSTWVDNYPESTYNPALYEILFTTDGIGMICGSQGWYYRKAPLLTAGFTSGTTHVCQGGTVQFTDQSIGDPTGWNWTFEGGTPSTSTSQNPLITYSTAGVYDVSLTVTIGAITNTLTLPDLIHVESPVTSTPAQPAGPAEICGLFEYPYTTSPVAGATSYSWTADPASAGTFSGAGTTGTLTASNTWNGAFTVKVAGANACGNGPESQVFNVTLTHQPNAFSLFSGGGYCTGENGYEIKLEDSDIGVDYQLYKDGIALGPLVPGTGNLLNFGLQTTGVYTVTGVNGNCFATMVGSAEVYIIEPAAAAVQPAGPAASCNDAPSSFTATIPANAYSLVWTLTPSAAGTVSQPDATTATVTWTAGYSGSVAVSVQGENECGPGPASPAFTLTIYPLPEPVASGITSVCKNQEMTYITTDNSGSSYNWAITGGTITSGQGSPEVTVLWGNTGTGTVSVTETSAQNCTGISPSQPVAINECTGLLEPNAKILDVYPNPATETLNIALNTEFNSTFTISIYNQTGQVVAQFSHINAIKTRTLSIDISALSPGVYTLRIGDENQTCNKLFVKR
jgi:PKD repeat protein